jgi:hypothetical protein
MLNSKLMSKNKIKKEETEKEQNKQSEEEDKPCLDDIIATVIKKDTYPHKKIVTADIQLNALLKSITGNWIFFLALFFCFYKLKQSTVYNSSYFHMVYTFVFIGFLGHFSHLCSHYINFTEVYKNCDNIFTQNKYTNFLLYNYVRFIDFHDKIHHDTSINKQFINILTEFINNVYIQGVGLVMIIKLLDIRVILLWAFMYATMHNINYLYLKPTTHRDHHINDHTNFGLDIFDIILNTKYDYADVEVFNHGAINLLVITYIIIYFTG